MKTKMPFFFIALSLVALLVVEIPALVSANRNPGYVRGTGEAGWEVVSSSAIDGTVN